MVSCMYSPHKTHPNDEKDHTKVSAEEGIDGNFNESTVDSQRYQTSEQCSACSDTNRVPFT